MVIFKNVLSNVILNKFLNPSLRKVSAIHLPLSVLNHRFARDAGRYRNLLFFISKDVKDWITPNRSGNSEILKERSRKEDFNQDRGEQNIHQNS